MIHLQPGGNFIMTSDDNDSKSNEQKSRQKGHPAAREQEGPELHHVI